MFETFAERQLVGQFISMGYVMMVALMLIVGFVAARRSQQPGLALLGGATASSMVGITLVVLALLTSWLDLSWIFSFASPRLAELITFGHGIGDAVGLLLPVVGGVVVGLLAGGLAIVPPLGRRAIVVALVATALLSLLRDVIAVLLPGGISKFFFTSTGLTLIGAVLVLVLSAALTLASQFWQRYLANKKQHVVRDDEEQAAARHSVQWWAGMVLVSIFLVSFPLWSKAFLSNVADFVGLYIIMGLGLNLVIGFAGMLDLGFVAFYALGAYTMAILTSPVIGYRLFGTPQGEGLLTFWQALPFSMIVATIGGALLALPILKMRGDYLAIATLGFGEIIRILSLSDFLKPYTGGAQGITRIARPLTGYTIHDRLIPDSIATGDVFIPLHFTIPDSLIPNVLVEGDLTIPETLKDPQHFYYLILVGCLVAWFIASRLKYSRLGRAWMAIREDEDVAQAMGINRVMVKLSAFVIGAFLGGMSGGIFASFVGSVVPKSFELLVSINVLALIIVGGMGSLPGVVVGAIAMVGLPELLREFREYRMLVYGAVVVLMMLYRPQGLWPEQTVAREMREAREKAAEQKREQEANRHAEQEASAAPPPSSEG
jgi:branched-chain amino acid transport system permease protein